MSVWYDVSGLYNWEGAFTGIQRVVYNLGKELHEVDGEARFFIFQNGNFDEITYQDLESRVAERLARRVTVETKVETRQSKRAIVQHHGMIMAKQLVLGSRLERPLRKSYVRLRGSYRSVRPREEPRPMEQTIFGADDVVVVVDGNWQFPQYAQRIIAAKKMAKFKLVHMVHDLVAVRNPAFANPGAQGIIGSYFKKIFPETDMLLAASESTKRDIEWFIKQQHIKTQAAIEVLLEGNSLAASDKREARKPEAKLPAEFILSVSTIEIRKNYTELYYAYKLAHQKGIALPHLVIAGRKGWMSDEVFALLTNDVDINGRVTILQGPPDNELVWLYEHCLFTVVPAFYEGWGLTVAEAFAFGKACVSSNTSSMPEVGKDMALYISPFDTGELLRAIQSYLDNAERQKVEKIIREHYTAYTWSQSAATLEELLGSLG